MTIQNCLVFRPVAQENVLRHQKIQNTTEALKILMLNFRQRSLGIMFPGLEYGIEENGPSSYIIAIENTNAPPGGMHIDLVHDWDGAGKMTRFSSIPAYELVTTEALEDAEFYYTLNEETNEKEYRFIRPTSVRYLSSCFGWRPSTDSFHSGIDIAHHSSVPIFASAPGTIIKIGTAGGFGKQVIIKHDDYKFQGIKKGTKIATQYAHLRNFSESIYRDNSEAKKVYKYGTIQT